MFHYLVPQNLATILNDFNGFGVKVLKIFWRSCCARYDQFWQIYLNYHCPKTDNLNIILHVYPSKAPLRGKAGNGKDALHFLNKTLPDVLIMDLNMPVLDGQISSEKILKLFPAVKILVLSMYNTVSIVKTLKDIGIMGYLPKDTDSNLLFSVIREIFLGNFYFNASHIVCAKNEFSETDDFIKKYNLTRRELKILRLIAKNHSSAEIANKLFISLFTVDTHRKNMIQKLKVDKKAGLLNFALNNKL